MNRLENSTGESDIIFVDDDSFLRNLFTQVLQRAGYRVASVENGRLGLERVEKDRPPLVITDIYMDEMDGIELIKCLREKHPGVKIIAISGGGQFNPHHLLNIATSMGADTSLPKPFSGDELLDTVRNVLGHTGGKQP